MYNKDWLEDPLMKIGQRTFEYHKSNNLETKQYDMWQIFHFATRLKLDGADFFCRQALGAASMPDDLGLPLLAHRQLEWYLDAFFFYLMSACDTLLQELNIVYAYDSGLKPENVSWDKIKGKLPPELADYMDKEWQKEWFYKVRSYRNMATHQYTVPLGSGKAGSGEEPLDYDEHIVSIHYGDKTGNVIDEEINVCIDYLKQMVRYVSGVWQRMTQKF